MIDKVTVGECQSLINSATAHCVTAVQAAPLPPQVIHEPNWEGVTTSLTALSADFALALLLLGVFTLIAGLGWGIFVKIWAEQAAKTAAESAARIWLEEKAPSLVRERVEFLYPLPQQPDGTTDDGDKAADEIGEKS